MRKIDVFLINLVSHARLNIVNWNWLLDAVNHPSADDDGAKGTGRVIYISSTYSIIETDTWLSVRASKNRGKGCSFGQFVARAFVLDVGGSTVNAQFRMKCVRCWSFVGRLSLHRIFVLIRLPILLSRMTRVRLRSVVASVECRRVQLIVNYEGVSVFCIECLDRVYKCGKMYVVRGKK